MFPDGADPCMPSLYPLNTQLSLWGAQGHMMLLARVYQLLTYFLTLMLSRQRCDCERRGARRGCGVLDAAERADLARRLFPPSPAPTPVSASYRPANKVAAASQTCLGLHKARVLRPLQRSARVGCWHWYFSSRNSLWTTAGLLACTPHRDRRIVPSLHPTYISR